ncbi:NUDIX domain-containing protein [Actinoplanes sp. NEAU-A12]|uniref:NUDIX domain-containing protein n=1 Tax=Actinoplanes sandaracinus TaxID=3045177 RepID=A0ABT6WJM8_9ACTN|nr:NUDIX domain-containing protein [Actinoplanes sandaracinus]MDI6099934.1 NUDIX domain-containing protein [Actinoplanes sandaracinus]
MAEANEAPAEAARREVAEELGIGFGGGRLLVVDWVSPHGPWDDLVAFVFDGGVPAGETRAGIRLRDGELRQHRFVTPEVAASLLRDYVWRRVSAALECAANGTTAYLHNGSRV